MISAFRIQLTMALIMATLIVVSIAGWPARGQARSFYIADEDITIDGQVDESAWGEPVADDGENNPDRTRYCWSSDIGDWTEIFDPAGCTTYLYDEAGQIDILQAWFGVNEKNMVLAFSTATPMFSILDVTHDEFISPFDTEQLSQTGITELPIPFAHDMVFSFDQNPADSGAASFDWYIVANINYDIGTTSSDENFLEIWRESGDTAGFQADEDEVVEAIDTNDAESSGNNGATTEYMEIRQNIEKFYATTGITSGDEVNFRLETHSPAGDTTKAVRVAFTDSNEITENALVVGSGATAFTGQRAKGYAKATVTAYALDNQAVQLEFEAYTQKVGARVAIADINGDGVNEIITIPFRAMALPEWKVFNHQGELQASGIVPKKSGTRFKQYALAAGDVDGDGQADIVLSNATGNRLLVDVLKFKDGKLNRIDQYNEVGAAHYARGTWAEVANIDASDDVEEIVTAPMQGSAVLDVWSVADGTITQATSYNVTDEAGFKAGLQLAASAGAVLAVEHTGQGQLHMLVWDDTTGTLTTGPIDTITTDTTLGKIGDLAWFEGGTYAYSSFEKKTVTVHDYNSKDGGNDDVTLDTSSRGAFVDFYEVK